MDQLRVTFAVTAESFPPTITAGLERFNPEVGWMPLCAPEALTPGQLERAVEALVDELAGAACPSCCRNAGARCWPT